MAEPAATRPVLGILVGGASSRMGGTPKGLLPAPGGGEAIVARLAREGRAAGLEPILVGDAAPYAALLPDLPRIPDAPAGIGPLGGLAALLAHAGARVVVVVACDMPGVDRAALRQLLGYAPEAAAVAARRAAGAPWEPLFARYDPPRTLPALRRLVAEGGRSFQRFLCAIEVTPLSPALVPALVFEDWDTPEDVRP